MTRHFSMIRDFHLADFFTLGNGACGTAAIFFSMSHIAEDSIGKVYAAGSFRFFETYNVVAFLYLVMTVGLSLALRGLERRLRSRNPPP